MYADKAFMIAAFGEAELVRLTDRDASAGTIVDAVLEQALTTASADINGYLQGRYPLPLTVMPPNLAALCADIARYKLHDNAVSDVVKQRYEDAIRWCEKVAEGKIQLAPASDGSQQTSDADMVVMQSGGSLFNRNKTGGFI